MTDKDISELLQYLEETTRLWLANLLDDKHSRTPQQIQELPRLRDGAKRTYKYLGIIRNALKNPKLKEVIMPDILAFCNRSTLVWSCDDYITFGILLEKIYRYKIIPAYKQRGIPKELLEL